MNRRIFIEAIRTIQPGEELSYDYQIQRDSDDAPNVDEIFACRCGAEKCRGSMLEAAQSKHKEAKRKAPKRKAPKRKAPKRKPAHRKLTEAHPRGR